MLILFECQDDNERRYAIDTFWLENINFKKKIDFLRSPACLKWEKRLILCIVWPWSTTWVTRWKMNSSTRSNSLIICWRTWAMVVTALLCKDWKISSEGRKGCLPKTRRKQTKLLERVYVETLLFFSTLSKCKCSNFCPQCLCTSQWDLSVLPNIQWDLHNRVFLWEEWMAPALSVNNLGMWQGIAPTIRIIGGAQFRRGGFGGRGNSGRKFDNKKKNWPTYALCLKYFLFCMTTFIEYSLTYLWDV